MGIGSVNQQNEGMVLVTVLFILVSVVPVKPFPSTFYVILVHAVKT